MTPTSFDAIGTLADDELVCFVAPHRSTVDMAEAHGTDRQPSVSMDEATGSRTIRWEAGNALASFGEGNRRTQLRW